MLRKIKKFVTMNDEVDGGDQSESEESNNKGHSSEYEYLGTIDFLGEFGPIFKVKSKDDRIFALKMALIKGNKQMTRYWKDTMYQLEYLNNQKIVKYHKVWSEFPSGVEWYSDIRIYPHLLPMKYSFILMEYCSEGNLSMFMKEPQSYHLMEKLFKDIMKGIDYLHSEVFNDENVKTKEKMIHRNLTPKSIFLTKAGDEMVAKIGDFGYANYIRDKMSSGIGASFYMSPEKARGDSYDEKSDIFSLGVIFFQMLQCVEKGITYAIKKQTDVNANNPNPEDDIGTVAYGQIPKYFMNTYKTQATLITMMISHDPMKRPDAKETLNRLENPQNFEDPTFPSDDVSEFQQNYMIVKVLKSQRPEKSTSKSYKVTCNNENGKEYAVKFIELTRPCLAARARADINILTQLAHKNLVRYLHTWLEHPKDQKNRWEYPDYKPTNKESKYIFIQMEYCDKGSLTKFMKDKKITFSNAKEIFIELAEGLAFLHENDVIHRNLNPMNIFLKTTETGLNAKVGCFQFARQRGKKMTLKKGDIFSPYTSPEQRQSETYCPKTDVYALGVIFYEMLFGKADLHSRPKLTNTNVTYKAEIDLINWMTEPDPEIRFSAAQVKAWIQKNYLRNTSNGNGTNESIPLK